MGDTMQQKVALAIGRVQMPASGLTLRGGFRHEDVEVLARAALETCHHEELVTALKAAQQDLAETLAATLEAACPHDADGAIIKSEMDEPSRPMISSMESLLAQIDAALAKVEASDA